MADPSNLSVDLAATAIVLGTVGFILWIDSRPQEWIQKLLNWFPAMLLAYLIPAAITHLFGLDLSGVWLQGFSRNGIIPFAIVTLMSALPLGRLMKVGWKLLVLFVTGSLAIAVLPAALVWLGSLTGAQWPDLFIQEGYWKGLVPIVGSWIGGSTSQLVLKEIIDCPNELFLSVIIIDNILVNLWTLLMFQAIRYSDSLNSALKISAPATEGTTALTSSSKREQLMTVTTLLLTTLAVTWAIDDFVYRIAILSVIGLLLASVIKGWGHYLTVKIGRIAILLIMSILGLRLDFSRLDLPAAFVGLCVAWLLLHYIIMFLTAWMLRIHMAWLPIASMANLGGISTTPAVTAAYDKNWMPHAVLLAVLSMVTGNLWGLLTIYLFHWLGG